MNKSGLGKKNKKEEKPKSSVQLRHTYKAQTGRQHVRAVYRQMAQQPKSSTNRRRQQQLIGRWIREDEDDETASETFTCTCGARYKSATELEATPHSLSTKRTHGAHFFYRHGDGECPHHWCGQSDRVASLSLRSWGWRHAAMLVTEIHATSW